MGDREYPQVGEVWKHPAVLATALICLTLLAWKVISVLADPPYQYEVLQAPGPQGTVESIYRIDKRTGEAVEIERSWPLSSSWGVKRHPDTPD